MISYNMCFPALTTFYSGKLFCLTMKLLNFPAYAAHLPYSICVVLSHVVRNNTVRASGKTAQPGTVSLCDLPENPLFLQSCHA